jgi:hypothetical protein
MYVEALYEQEQALTNVRREVDSLLNHLEDNTGDLDRLYFRIGTLRDQTQMAARQIKHDLSSTERQAKDRATDLCLR